MLNEILTLFAILVYLRAGIWALNKLYYSRFTFFIVDYGDLLLKKLIYALFFGWLLIPVAVLITIIKKVLITIIKKWKKN